MNIIFPMAGQGARFGHRFKPFLTIGDSTFIEAAVNPFRRFVDRISQFVFVYLERQEQQFAVQAQLKRSFSGLPLETVRLQTPTNGPVETVTGAIKRLNLRGPAMVCDCDHEIDVAPLFDAAPADAVIPVWPLEDDNLAAWSVARVADGRVTAIAEKTLPSGAGGDLFGVIGCYSFADIADTIGRGERLRALNFSEVIADLVGSGSLVHASKISSARFFGDPARLARALNESLQ